MLGPQPDARSVRQPEPSAFGLLPGDLQPLASPNPLDPLVVDEPACSAQQLGDLAVAVASVLSSKLNDVGAEPLLAVSTTRDLALRRAMLASRLRGSWDLAYARLGTRPKMAATAAIKTIKAIKPTLIQPFRVSSSSAGGTAEVQSIMVSVRSDRLLPCSLPRAKPNGLVWHCQFAAIVRPRL
jgi:hypothetical protein